MNHLIRLKTTAVNAMLLNEFLKEHRKVQELESVVSKQEASAVRQEAAIAQQQKQIETLTAGLQKVSAQLELNKPAPQIVLNNQLKLSSYYHSLKSPTCSCVAITLPAPS